MAHFIGPDVTSNEAPSIHAGINYKSSTFKVSETVSGSQTIAMCIIPGGARVTHALLTIDNDALDTTGGGNVVIESWNAGARLANIIHIKSASGSAVIYTYNPTHEANGYRHTSSSHAVLSLHNFVKTGTATTVFQLALQYDMQLDPD